MSAVLSTAELPVVTTGPAAELDLAAVTANTRTVAARTPAAVMAVVKADGYGLGAAAVAGAALRGGARSVGVTTVAEALALRAAGITAPVLSWLNPAGTDFRAAVAAGVELAVPGRDHLAAMPRGARVHLHLDTGMARDGAPATEWAALCRAARDAERDGRVRVVGLMSHLACADRPGSLVSVVQRHRFGVGVATARRLGLNPEVLHLASTAATFVDPASHHDMVRVGAGLLGIDPTGTVALRSTVRLSAPLNGVRRVAAGTPVGYDHTWHAPRATVLGLVGVGYAEGIPRQLSERAQVQVGDRRCAVVGRVSMDQLVVDLGPGFAPGNLDRVTLFGSGADGGPTLREWAGWTGRLEAELLVGLGPRVTRTTTDGSRWNR